MSKRYRLVIPEKVKKSLARIAGCLIDDYDGGVLELKHHSKERIEYHLCGTSRNWCSEIPGEWLEEIKEPKTFEDWFENRFDCGLSLQGVFTQGDLKSCYNWTVENERKKHEPKQSFEAYVKKLHPGLSKTHPEYDWIWLGWRSANENRGYDE